MEQARKILQGTYKQPLKTEIAYASKLKDDPDGARTSKYLCIDEECNVPVFPAAFDDKKNSANAPSPYFRCGKVKHSKTCQGDGKITTKKTTDALKAKTSRTRRKRPKAPNIFAFTVTRNTHISGKTAADTKKKVPGTDGECEPSRRGNTIEGQSRANTVRHLAEAFLEMPPEERLQTQLRLPKQGWLSYEQAFVNVGNATSVTSSSHPRVYWGTVKEVTSYPSGMLVLWGTSPRQRSQLSAWLPNDLTPAAPANAVRQILADYHNASDNPVLLFVYGSFQRPFHGQRLSIEVEVASQFWAVPVSDQ